MVICFIAISYFGSKDLGPYIDSLISQRDGRWLLKIVDNSLDPGESERLRQLASCDQRIEVWTSSQNLGYFGAAEWARERIANADFAWIAVTNTDVVLESNDFVATVHDSTDPTLGVLAPTILGSSSHSDLNPYMYTRPTVARSRLRRLLFWNVYLARATVVLSHLWRCVSKRPQIPSCERDIYAAHGSFMIFGRPYFAHQGTFRHTSFLFGEELTVAEFCRTRGIRTVFSPKLRVVHTEHSSTGVLRSRTVLEAQVAASKNALRLISSHD